MCEIGLKRAIVVMAAMALRSPACSAEFAGGTGEPDDPYQIAAAGQLVSIGSNESMMDKHFILLNDIDLEPTLPGGQIFDRVVIAQSSLSPFVGTLDGNGHSILNLNLTVESGWKAALIGEIGPEGHVRDLGLVGVRISGQYGGPLAVTNEGLIQNCYSVGTVNAEGRSGGLVSENRGTITDCHSNCEVTGSGHAGGLVGFSYRGSISGCYATGSVVGTSRVGGLVGEAWYTAITRCYASGAVVGSQKVGGLVGRSTSNSVVHCYSTGSVSGDNYVGGLVGELWFASVGWCYANGSVTGVDLTGGLVGGVAEYAKGPVESSFFLSREGGGGPDNGYGAALTLEEMGRESSYFGWDFCGVGHDGPNGRWFLPPGGPPVLAWQTEVSGLLAVPALAGLPRSEAESALANAGFVVGKVYYDYDGTVPFDHVVFVKSAGYAPVVSSVDVVLSSGTYDWRENPGSGSPEEPYRIASPGQLESLRDHLELWDKHFILENDIDLSGRTYRRALIAADAEVTDQDHRQASFTGSFDGNSLAIRHLTIEPDASHYQQLYSLGLFSKVGPGGDIRNLRLVDVKISTTVAGARASGQMGALAAESDGTISQCSVTGSVVGGGRGRNVGALIGLNEGQINSSFSGPGVVVGDNQVGGFVGQNKGGTIQDCYSVMCVGADGTVGGLIGLNLGGTVLSSYAAGVVSGAQDRSGGLIGESLPLDGMVVACFWDTESTGQIDSGGGMGLTTSEMMDTNVYALNGWADNPTWTIDGGKDYPRLAWEGKPGTNIHRP